MLFFMNVDATIERLNRFAPMSVFEDLGIVTDIFKYLQPKAILELGSGGGGWILAINDSLKNNAVFLGYEDFRLNYGNDWHKNSDELTQYLQITGDNQNIIVRYENVNHLDLEYIKKLGIKFDVVRLDCLENREEINQLFYKIYPYTSEQCIFLVDDIVPNICPNRFLAYMDKVYDRILKPVWFGNKEGAWCKNTYECGPLQDYILNEMSGKIAGKNENIIWYSLEYRIIFSWGGL